MVGTRRLLSGLEALGPRLAEYVPELLRVTGTPGLSVAIAVDGEVVHAGGYGLADVEAGMPMRADAVFPAGSLTKTYTVVAVLQQVEAGRLGLDDPVAAHLPELALVNPHDGHAVTVRELITFRSGLATDTTAAGIGPVQPLAERLAEAFAATHGREYGGRTPVWTAPAGERFAYSNLGYAVLGRLVERVSGEGLGFGEHLARHVLAPLGCTDSRYAPELAMLPAELQARHTTGYAGFGARTIRSPVLASSDAPSNGLRTTALDHLRLLVALQHGGGALLAPQLAAAMRTPQAPLGDPRIAEAGWWVGLGLLLGPGGAHYGHPGSHPWGWWNLGRVIPALGVAFVIACNRWDMLRWQDPANPDATSLLAEWIPRMLDHEPGERRSWAWKRDHLAGYVLAERTCGLLGVEDGLLVAPATPAWGHDALARGLHAGRAWATAPPEVPPEDVELLSVDLGGPRHLPLPLEL